MRVGIYGICSHVHILSVDDVASSVVQFILHVDYIHVPIFIRLHLACCNAIIVLT